MRLRSLSLLERRGERVGGAKECGSRQAMDKTLFDTAVTRHFLALYTVNNTLFDTIKKDFGRHLSERARDGADEQLVPREGPLREDCAGRADSVRMEVSREQLCLHRA